jgi:riboflavin kinase/FMN adenylyltransferase
MEIIKGIENLERPFRNPVVTLGNFDGIHLGHQRIFSKVIDYARRIDGESVVITFEPHPLKVLLPGQCPPLLTPFRKKMMLIEKTGIEKVLCIEFTKDFSETSPSDFVKRILSERIGTKKVIVGYNYRFGSGKIGNVEFLKKTGAQIGMEVEVVDPLTVEDTIVSSSKIREFIKEGEVERASQLLGRDYPVIGRVIEGVHRGRDLGFRTANLDMTEEIYPKPGVYAVRVKWQDLALQGLASIGFNPTFDTKTLSLEVHILNFDREIYGDEIQVSFIKRIRDEVRFHSPQDLIRQVQRDIEWARENVFGSQ